MSKIKVMCTSTGCIEYAPKRYMEEHDIDIIRIKVLFKGKEMLEGLDLNPDEFYSELETLEDVKKNLPKTAMPTVDEVKAHFDKAIADGYDEIIVIAISSGLGGTYNVIRLAAEEYKDKIKVHAIDSRITAFAEGLLAIKASEFVKKGLDSETILKELDWIKNRYEFFGIDGRLDYLIYNGRLKGGKAFLGKLLSICPVIHFNKEGECVPICSVRTQKKALQKTCEILKEMVGDRDEKDYILLHTYTGTSVLDKLVEIEKEYGIKCNHERVVMSPVSGAHNGPWLAGYVYVPIRRDDEPLE